MPDNVVQAAQARLTCSDKHVETCPPNPAQTPIPIELGGAPIRVPNCSNSLVYALASLYSYDSTQCDHIGPNGGSAFALRHVTDATAEYLPPDYAPDQPEDKPRAFVYCDSGSNSLIVAFRGSVTPSRFIITPLVRVDEYNDWFATNLVEFLGKLTVQYGGSRDIAFNMKRSLAEGRFNDFCGQGIPSLVLTGHSKGGGQAQYAAVKEKLPAIVFNANPVNPVLHKVVWPAKITMKYQDTITM